MSPIATEQSHRPLTVVQDGGHITMEELAARIVRSREAVYDPPVVLNTTGDMLQAYHQLWYESGHTWVYTNFLGIGMMKSPTDLWAYHDIMVNHRPMTVIETGTYQGGSALWFAFLMDMLNIEGGRVYTVDIEDRLRGKHPRVTYMLNDSRDPELVKAIRGEMPSGPLLVVLDSDHSEAHVRAELELYAPLLNVGDWLVVEDTNIGWSDGAGGGDRGARGGLEDYLKAHPGEFRQDLISERYLLTMHPGGWLQRMAEPKP